MVSLICSDVTLSCLNKIKLWLYQVDIFIVLSETTCCELELLKQSELNWTCRTQAGRSGHWSLSNRVMERGSSKAELCSGLQAATARPIGSHRLRLWTQQQPLCSAGQYTLPRVPTTPSITLLHCAQMNHAACTNLERSYLLRCIQSHVRPRCYCDIKPPNI